MLSGRTFRTSEARKAASSCAVRPTGSSAVRGVNWQRGGSRRTLSKRRRVVRPAACVIRSQKGELCFNGRSSDIVQGVLGVPWLKDTHLVAANSVPGNNSVLSMRGADMALEISMCMPTRRNSLRTASPGSGILVAALPSIE
ncbi:hypothetical protein TcG_11961 [Trypanosoma cruzi]|nr:hypothetical protein TcG_11961 [Trypanosoma cruzi]